MPIIITSRRDGFRRCGVAHRAAPVTWPDARFTAAELATLRTEPMLTVTTATDVPDVPDMGDIDQIVAAIAMLDTADKTSWTSGGKPQVAALEKVLQKQISAAQRDEAWETYQE